MHRYGKNTTSIRAKKGEPFVVVLESLPGAGYTWQVADGLDRLRLLSRVPMVNASGIGAAATEEFKFEPTAPGVTRLVLRYGRQWEPMPAETLEIPVTVDS